MILVQKKVESKNYGDQIKTLEIEIGKIRTIKIGLNTHTLINLFELDDKLKNIVNEYLNV